MIITKTSQAGSFESNDIHITLSPNPNEGIQLHLSSVVMKQFGDQIKDVILTTLHQHHITSCIIECHDQGALDFTIKARVESAIARNI